MNTKTTALSAARTELQGHLASVNQKLFATRTAQTIRRAMDKDDPRLTHTIARLEEQQQALHGILALICDRLNELEPAGSVHRVD